jgi:hypothetical protein
VDEIWRTEDTRKVCPPPDMLEEPVAPPALPAPALPAPADPAVDPAPLLLEPPVVDDPVLLDPVAPPLGLVDPPLSSVPRISTWLLAYWASSL